ncbi:MAG: helix-turn-helix transcriptional regulator, partial [Bacteroidota bacterium]
IYSISGNSANRFLSTIGKISYIRLSFRKKIFLMISNNQIISLIFGFKLRYLRQKFGLSYHELAEKTGLSTSYLNDIEKGKKYPKPDKITTLAEAFGLDYDYMVSTTSSKKLKPIIDLLNSKFLKLFPLD